jgi:hypothetical protein
LNNCRYSDAASYRKAEYEHKRPAKARKKIKLEMKASAEERAAIKQVRAQLKANMLETLRMKAAELELKGLQAELKALDQVVGEAEERTRLE